MIRAIYKAAHWLNEPDNTPLAVEILARILARWHGLDHDTARTAARACFRSDVYRDALGPQGVDMPGASEKVEGAMAVPTTVASALGHMILGPDRFFDGAVFDFGSPQALKK